jgi:hypothetical protein
VFVSLQVCKVHSSSIVGQLRNLSISVWAFAFVAKIALNCNAQPRPMIVHGFSRFAFSPISTMAGITAWDRAEWLQKRAQAKRAFPPSR